MTRYETPADLARAAIAAAERKRKADEAASSAVPESIHRELFEASWDYFMGCKQGDATAEDRLDSALARYLEAAGWPMPLTGEGRA